MSTEAYWVKKNPSPDTLTVRRCRIDHEPDPANWQWLTLAEIEAYEAAERAAGWAPVVMPPSDTPWAISNGDFRRGLIERGIDPELVTAHLRALPDGPGKWLALADWEYANYFERSHPLLDQLAPSFNLSATDLDALFRAKPAYPRA